MENQTSSLEDMEETHAQFVTKAKSLIEEISPFEKDISSQCEELNMHDISHLNQAINARNQRLGTLDLTLHGSL